MLAGVVSECLGGVPGVQGGQGKGVVVEGAQQFVLDFVTAHFFISNFIIKTTSNYCRQLSSITTLHRTDLGGRMGGL